MSEAKYTPGPWVTKTDGHGRGRIYRGDLWLATAWISIGNGNNAPPLPAEANARLISAAPELLEALQAAQHYITLSRDSFAECNSYPDGMMDMVDQATLDGMNELLARMNAAIAKVDGV